MLPYRVSNPGPLTYESAALPIALCAIYYSHTLSAEAKMVLQTFATSKWFNQLAHLHSRNRFYAICTLHV